MSMDPMQGPMREEDPVVLINALLAAIRSGSEKAAAATSAAEYNDFAKGALGFAQTIITMDPSRLAGGDTPEARAAAAPKLPPTKDGDKDGKIGS